MEEAEVEHVLVDPFNVKNADAFKYIAMDSGAYRAFKKEVALPAIPAGNWEFVVSPDVIGDPQASWSAWMAEKSKMPVWHWGEPMKLLRWYLQEAKGVIGIGGCVDKMRERSGPLWHGLYKICQMHPGRFHVFGANWLELLSRISPYIVSADTSKWLDGARYGEIIDTDLKPFKSELSRQDRCVVYARVMNEVFNADHLKKKNFFQSFLQFDSE